MEEQELRCHRCGGPLEKGQMWVDNPPAYACRSCRKIILPY